MRFISLQQMPTLVINKLMFNKFEHGLNVNRIRL